MYSCFACMACNDICPVGIHPAELALSMRHVQEQIRPVGWKQTLFGGLISHAKRMEAGNPATAALSNAGHPPLGLRAGAEASVTRASSATWKPCCRIFRSARCSTACPTVTEARGETKYRVGFFLGCAQNLLFAEESAATVRVPGSQRLHGGDPRETECCGMPARGYGRMDLVQAAARRNIATLRAGRGWMSSSRIVPPAALP